MINNPSMYYRTFYPCYSLAYEDLLQVFGKGGITKMRARLPEKNGENTSLTKNDLTLMLLEWYFVLNDTEAIALDVLEEKVGAYDDCFGKIKSIIDRMIETVLSKDLFNIAETSYLKKLQVPLEESYVVIQRIINAKQEQFPARSVFQMKEDENSLFRAISHQLSLLHDEKLMLHHSAVRELVSMRSPGKQADEEEIESLSLALNMQIVVIDVRHKQIIKHGEDDHQSIYLRVNCKDEGGSGHYDSVMDSQEAIKQLRLERSAASVKKWTPSCDGQISSETPEEPDRNMTDSLGGNRSGKKKISFNLGLMGLMVV